MVFCDDTRSQSVQIGVVLLLGMAVIGFSTYQATVVPSQNGKVEFKHFQDARNDMVDVRNSILTAGQADIEQYPDVTLGTNYPPRIATLNPSPISGTIRTSETYNITITNATGARLEIPTQFIEYRPEYNQIRSGSTWYENSVLYLDERSQGGDIVIIEDQNLLVGGNTLRITALQGSVSIGGTRQVTLDLFPAENVTEDQVPKGELTIQIPTRLSAGEYWNSAFPDAPPGTYQGVDETAYPGDSSIYGVELNINTSRSATKLKLNTVGIQSEPSNNPQKQNVGAVGGSGSGSGSTGSGTTGDPLPSGDMSFDDENGNGVYDDGENSYSASELAQGFDQTGVDLVVTEDISTSSGLDLKADTVTIQDGVTLDSTQGQVNIESYNGDTTIAGKINAKNDISFTTSGNDIDASGGTVDTSNGKVTLTTDSGGNIDLSGSYFTDLNDVLLQTGGGGDIDVSQSTIDTSNGKVTLTTDSGGDINASGTTVLAKNDIKFETDGGGNIDASKSTLDTDNGNIELITAGTSEIDIQLATIQSKNTALADTNSEGTVDVTDGKVRDTNGDPATLDANGTIVGSLATGTVN